MGHLSATEYDQLLAAKRNELGPLCQEPEPQIDPDFPNDPKCRHCGKPKNDHWPSLGYCFPNNPAAGVPVNTQRFEPQPNETPKPLDWPATRTISMSSLGGPGLEWTKDHCFEQTKPAVGTVVLCPRCQKAVDYSGVCNCSVDNAPALRAVAAVDDPICRNCGQRKSIHVSYTNTTDDPSNGTGKYCFSRGKTEFDPLRPDDKGFPPNAVRDACEALKDVDPSQLPLLTRGYRNDMLMFREKFHAANEEIERLRNEQIPKERDQAWHAGYYDGKKEIRKQLPEDMQNCTIECKQCNKGHSRLIAKNWIDHGCLVCVLEQRDRRIDTLLGIESSLRDELAKADERRCNDLKMQDTAWHKKLDSMIEQSTEEQSEAYNVGIEVGADNKAKSMRYWVLFWSILSMFAGAVLNALTHK